MRLDEMIVKASADGKTYINNGYKAPATYSAATGFTYDGKPWCGEYSMAYITGWKELPKRHLTVAEAEKEWDCIIDTDLPKMLKPANDPPKDGRDVIVFFEDTDVDGRPRCNYGQCAPTCFLTLAKLKPQKCKPICWIDPEDILSLYNK